MRKHTRTLLVGISALITLGTLSACNGGTSTETTPAPETAPTTATAAPFPQSAKYIADMPSPNGKTMTIGIAVDGTEVAAYACNGIDDEAWFFGNQSDGTIDITGRFRDTLKASFNGKDVVGDLTMNGVPYHFTAPAVPAPAGMYTAEFEGVRASWVMRADGSATGVQNNGLRGSDITQAELQQLRDDQFRNEVRNKRQLQQAQQIVRLQDRGFTSTINGHPVTLVVVNGNFRL
ncbi:hypothetical protein [Mycobacterium hubeiense]|uniref:hypothetical protein n=1 Tax=Mycobacterium hubeiense TaxID=1867256 RepID=UPI000C7E9F2D|nr:hypothetical protein [Mycobacterium sp. QGD 101]